MFLELDRVDERDREVVDLVPEYTKPYTVLTPEYYTAGLELNPNNAKSWFELGLLLVDDPTAECKIHGRQHSAKECFEFAVRIFPADAEAWFRLGICMQAAGSAATTDIIKGLRLGPRECFEQCVRNKPDNAAAWYNIGVLLSTFDRTNKVGDRFYERHECFHKALTIDDSDAMAWFNLGVSLPPGTISREVKGLVYTPRQCFEQSILRNPKDPDVWYNLGCALEGDDLSIPLRHDKQFNRQQCFELTLRMNPMHKSAWYNLGVLLSPSTQNGTIEGTKSHTIDGSSKYYARDCFERAVTIDPMWAVAWYNLGQCVLPDGYTASSIKGKQYSKTQCFEISLRIDPTSSDAWAELGMSLENGCYSSSIDDTAKRFSKQRCFESALGINVNNAMYWYCLGHTLQHCEGTAEGGDTRRHKWSREIEGYTYNQQLCFERSVMLDASPAAVWNDLGVALPSNPVEATTNLLDGRSYKKQHCFEASLERDMSSAAAAAAWYNLAMRIAILDQDAERAKWACDDDAHVLTPRRTNVAVSNPIRGIAYSRRQCLEHALVLDNLHAESWLQLGIVLPDPHYLQVLDAGYSMTPVGKPGSDAQYEKSFIHGDRVGKQDCLERCLRLASLSSANEAEAWNRLGVVLAKDASVNIDGVVYDKRLCFEKSLKLDPLQAEPWFNLGVALPRGELSVSLGKGRCRFSEQECFEQTLRRNPDHPSAWHNLGTALPDDHARSNNIFPNAAPDAEGFTRIECFRRAVELERLDWEHWSCLGECLLREDQRRAKLNAKQSHSATIAATVAAASVSIFGRRWTALECTTRAVEYSNMRSPEAWVNLGRALPPDAVVYLVAENRHIAKPAVVEIAGMPHTKQACYEAALGLNPRHVYAWYYLGCVLPPGGVTEDLGGYVFNEQECFEQVLRFDPSNAEAWYNVGLLIGDPLHHKASCALKYRDMLSNDINDMRYTKQQCFEACLFHAHQRHAGAWYYLGMVLPRDRSTLGRPHRNPAVVVDEGGDDDDRCVTKQECFERALQISPDDGKSWCELALLLPEHGGLSNEISGKMYSKAECMEQALALQYDERVGVGSGKHVYLS
jgi:tetratricopeptide (TPR) repeat protein